MICRRWLARAPLTTPALCPAQARGPAGATYAVVHTRLACRRQDGPQTHAGCSHDRQVSASCTEYSFHRLLQTEMCVGPDWGDGYSFAGSSTCRPRLVQFRTLVRLEFVHTATNI